MSKLSVFAVSAVWACFACRLALADENTVILRGEVTSINVVDLDMIVIASDSVSIIVPCPETNVGCTELHVGDNILVLGHLGDAVEVCGGTELPRNPIVVDVRQLCNVPSACKPF